MGGAEICARAAPTTGSVSGGSFGVGFGAGLRLGMMSEASRLGRCSWIVGGRAFWVRGAKRRLLRVHPWDFPGRPGQRADTIHPRPQR